MPVEKQKTYESGTFIQLAHTTLSSPKLSWGALGLWHYMLSKPLHWKFSFNELVNSSKDGVFKVNSYLKELIKSGYVERIKKRDKNGRFSYDFLAKEIVLSELSGSQKTVAVSSDTDSTAAGNSIPNYIDNKLYIKDLSQEKREKINKREKKESSLKVRTGPITQEEQAIYTWAQRDPFWSMYVKDLSSLRKQLLSGALKSQYERATQKTSAFDPRIAQEALRLSAQFRRK